METWAELKAKYFELKDPARIIVKDIYLKKMGLRANNSFTTLLKKDKVSFSQYEILVETINKIWNYEINGVYQAI
jgi:hypothetical protein